MSVGPIDIELRMRQNLDSESKKAGKGVDDVNKELAEQDKLLSSVNAKQKEWTGIGGKSTQNAQQYAARMNNLNMSIQQVARELPSLAISPQTFILAISNNLPILQDQLQKTRLENEALKASGQSTVPVWKQVAKSMVSPQTALVALITIGSVFGKDIIDWTKKMLNFSDAAKLTGKEIKNLTSEIGENLGAEMGKLDRYFDKLETAKEGTYDYYKAKEDIIDQYGEYLDGLDGEISKLNDVEGAYLAIAKAIREQAREKALESAYSKEGQKLIEETAQQYETIRGLFLEEFGTEWGDQLFRYLREDLEKNGKLGADMQYMVDSFTKRSGGMTTSGGTVTTTSNDVEDAIDAISEAQDNYNKKIKESKSLLGSLFSDGNATEEIKSLIKEQEQLLKQAKLMPESTEEEITAKNKKVDAIEKEIERLKALGIEEDKRKKASGEDDKARAEERLLRIKTKLQNEIAAAELAAMKEGAAQKLAAVKADYEKRKKVIAQNLREIEQLEKVTGKKATPQRALIEKATSANEQRYAAESTAVEQQAATEIQKVWDEVNVKFRTDLENRLAEVDKFYQEQYKLLKQNITDESLLKSAITYLDQKREDEITQVRAESAMKQIELETEVDLNRQKIANQSIMLEADRQKKLLEIEIKGSKQRLKKLKEMEAAGADVSGEIKETEAGLEAMNAELGNLQTARIEEIGNLASSAMDELAGSVGMLDEGLGKALGSMADLSGHASQFASSLASGNITGAITGAVGAATTLVGLFSNAQSKQEAAARAAENFRRELELQNRALERQVELMNETSGDDRFKAESNSLKLISSQIEDLNKRAAQLDVKVSREAAGMDFEEKIADVNNVEQLIYALEKSQRIQDVIEQFNSWGFQVDNYDELLEIIDSYDSLIEKRRELMEDIIGSSTDDISNSLVEGLKAGEDALEAFGNTFENVMTNALVSTFEKQYIQQYANELYDEIAKFTDPENSPGLTENELKQLETFWQEKQKQAESGWEATQKILESLGGSDPMEDTRSGYTKGIAQASQDSIDELNGRLMAVSGNVYSIRENNAMMLEMERESLIHRRAITSQLEAIAANTAYCRYLEDMNNTLEDINNRGVKIKE